MGQSEGKGQNGEGRMKKGEGGEKDSGRRNEER